MQPVVRNLGENIKTGLRRRVDRRDRSVEAEVLDILQAAVEGKDKVQVLLGRDHDAQQHCCPRAPRRLRRAGSSGL